MNNNTSNRLINETSPYLLQHAYNPVDWYPWGEEALQKAKDENKPILVSIGYSACHWCHVMERESFEDIDIAAFMNTHFINIKIDREERPDLDHIYMDAVQAMSGGGGWPLNVFLTPEQQPFYGGTYFPPQRSHNRASWLEVLQGVSKGYIEKKLEIINQAKTLTDHLIKSNSFGIVLPDKDSQPILFSEETLVTVAENILTQADKNDGGFGNAPKFPQSFCIIYLLRQYHHTKDKSSLDQALLSINKMIQGGLFDQLGGGFARYSTDAKWLVPHFEKMLYDNALLVMAIAEAYQLTANEYYRSIIDQTLSFIQRELTHLDYGFYSALDADSEGVEGKFYTWSFEELQEILGDNAHFFCAYYQVEKKGNWQEGMHENPPTNILFTNSFPTENEIALLKICREQLMSVRAKRIRPLLDDKILLGWNALMVTAYCKAYSALGNQEYKVMAEKNILFLESNLKDSVTNRWHHTYKNGIAKIPAFLDDYAYLTQAYIHLQEITGKSDYLLKARAITNFVIAHFTETSTGFFYYTPDFQHDILLRKKEVYDGATPSGNAVMMENLHYLSIVFDNPTWQKLVFRLIHSLGNAITKHPTSFAFWACVLQTIVKGYNEIVIAGQQASSYLDQINSRFIPNKIIQAAETNLPDFSLLNGKVFDLERVSFYLCCDNTCKPAFYSVNELLANM